MKRLIAIIEARETSAFKPGWDPAAQKGLEGHDGPRSVSTLWVAPELEAKGNGVKTPSRHSRTPDFSPGVIH